MKTVILSGGRGYRLKEETDFKPKPMVTVGGKPILWHIMKIYTHYGYNEFFLTLGYKGDYIKDYFINQKYFSNNFTLYTKDGKIDMIRDRQKNLRDDFIISFVDTGLDTLTGERVRRLGRYLNKGRFMLTYGDGVADIDIQKLVRFHKEKKVIATITGVHARSRWGQVKIDKKNMAVSLKQKPVFSEYVNGGFMVLEPEFLDYIKPGEMIEIALERLTDERKLAVFVHDGFWFAMDTYQDAKDLNALWESKAPWKIWE